MEKPLRRGVFRWGIFLGGVFPGGNFPRGRGFFRWGIFSVSTGVSQGEYVQRGISRMPVLHIRLFHLAYLYYSIHTKPIETKTCQYNNYAWMIRLSFLGNYVQKYSWRLLSKCRIFHISVLGESTNNQSPAQLVMGALFNQPLIYWLEQRPLTRSISDGSIIQSAARCLTGAAANHPLICWLDKWGERDIKEVTRRCVWPRVHGASQALLMRCTV